MSKGRFWNQEDYWAILIGGLILIVGLLVFISNPPENIDELQAIEQTLQAEASKAPFKTIEWYTASDQQLSTKATGTAIGKRLKNLTGKPGGWNTNPVNAFVTTEAKAVANNTDKKVALAQAVEAEKIAQSKAQTAQATAAAANFEDKALNEQAEAAISTWRSRLDERKALKKKANLQPNQKFTHLALLFLVFALLFGIAKAAMKPPILQFVSGFLIVFLLAIFAYTLAGQADLKALGLGYALWAIVIGLLISNTVGIPTWLQPALATSLYIKTGLVLLGAEILLGKVLAIGLPGIFVAWVVTPIVLISTYWFGQKVLKIPSKTLNITISADMSVCGVSAAVATAAASNASKEELTLAVGLSMLFTSVMMVVMPLFINWVGIPEILGGAWMGGTIDATGAVVAAGAFLGEKALSVAATIKMIQNILIGIVAFGVAIYFTSSESKEKVGLSEIWKRFPKFIIGFIAASVVFSLLYEYLGDFQAYTLIEQGVIAGWSKNMRGWLFCLAFVSIGLSTNFKMLRAQLHGGKPLLLYVLGQSFNLIFTLVMAYLMFYVVFDAVLEKI